MKKIISILLAVMLLLGLVACGGGSEEPTTPGGSTKPTAPTIDPADLEDYYAFGPEEMIIAKPGVTYAQHSEQIDGKTVYELISQGWNGEIWADKTAHWFNGEEVKKAVDVRDSLKANYYKYVAITFQLSPGAAISACHTVPVISEEQTAEIGLFRFTAGGVLSKNASYLEEFGDRFSVYSNGKQIKVGDYIFANQWYTFVCELQLDSNATLYGADSFINVALTEGNSKPVYVSEVRYYTNDSYKDDFGSAAIEALPDYVEMDSSELVVYKNKDDIENFDQKNITIYDRSNVYGVTFPAGSWNLELAAKTTITKSLYADSAFSSWPEVRNHFSANGYQYAAIDFALSEGATIRAIGCLPPTADGEPVVTGGLTFTDGAALAWGGKCTTDEQKAYFAVYSDGKEVKVGDTIEAGKWYTVVIKLLTDVSNSKDKDASWSSITFNVGNGKMVYFSGMRYYTNDTYKTDFAG